MTILIGSSVSRRMAFWRVSLHHRDAIDEWAAPRSSAALLGNRQHHFAELLAIFEALVRVGGALERHDAINHRLQQPALKQLERREELFLESHERAQNRKLPDKEIVDIDF